MMDDEIQNEQTEKAAAKKSNFELFVVSHDQDFLNSVCQEILHIEDLKLISYKVNYNLITKVRNG